MSTKKRMPMWAKQNVAFAAYLDSNYPLWRQWKDTRPMRLMKKLESAFVAGWEAARKR